MLDSKETTQDAIVLRRQLSEMLSGGGFHFRKWLSNEVEVIQDIPDNERVPGVDIPDGGLPSQKTLGVLWKAKHDIFSFNLEKFEKPETMTKNSLKQNRHGLRPLTTVVTFHRSCKNNNARNVDGRRRMG